MYKYATFGVLSKPAHKGDTSIHLYFVPVNGLFKGKPIHGRIRINYVHRDFPVGTPFRVMDNGNFIAKPLLEPLLRVLIFS